MDKTEDFSTIAIAPIVKNHLDSWLLLGGDTSHAALHAEAERYLQCLQRVLEVRKSLDLDLYGAIVAMYPASEVERLTLRPSDI